MHQSNVEWLRTEYEVVNQWRISKVEQNGILTYIFVPIATGTFFGSLLIESSFQWFPILAWAFSTFLIIFWRVYAHYLDDGIVNTYPRIVELEEKLSFQSTRRYLRLRWWPDKDASWLPTMTDVRNKIGNKIAWWNPRKYFCSPYGKRGQEPFNYLGLVLISAELVIALLVYL